jgi:hypothetical protein
MQRDPGQQQNVADQQPEVVSDLVGRYRRWFADVTGEGFAQVPTQVGLVEAAEVRLPAHEAMLHPASGEGIRYSGPAGWANDWIAGWTDPGAYAAWSLRVQEAGRYEVTLQYGAEPNQVGHVLTVQVGDQQIAATVPRPHPLVARASPDRVPRGESYEMDWAELTVGQLRLEPGCVVISVKPGGPHTGELISLKSVTLRRLPEGQP